MKGKACLCRFCFFFFWKRRNCAKSSARNFEAIRIDESCHSVASDVNNVNESRLFMPKIAAMLWNERESHKPKSRDSIEYKNLHKDVINIKNLISLHNLSILPHCLWLSTRFQSLRPPFYGFINLNLILFPRFVFKAFGI